MARLEFSISLEIFKILKFFNLWALRGGLIRKSLPKMWRNLAEIRAKKKAQNPVTSVAVVFFFSSVPKNAHLVLTHELFEVAVHPGTTSQLTRRKWVKFFYLQLELFYLQLASLLAVCCSAS